MTGTAKTEEEEFLSTYNMNMYVVQIPTNRPVSYVRICQMKYYAHKTR